LTHGEQPPKVNIVYVQGLSEFSEKKYELARDFNKMSCNFYIPDRYGQGRSDRYFPEHPHRQHSDGTAQDVADLVQFCHEHIDNDAPIILLGFSTGGLIALEALAAHPDTFDGLILASPLLGFADPLLKNREHLAARLPLNNPVSSKYIPGGTDYRPRNHPLNLYKEHDFTSDPERQKLQDIWAERAPHTKTGAPTFGWIVHMCRAIVGLQDKSKDTGKMEDITKPVICFTADDDKLINNDAVKKIVERIPHAQLVHIEEAKHEIFLERDQFRKPVLQKIADFLSRHFA